MLNIIHFMEYLFEFNRILNIPIPPVIYNYRI
jgi:hypothetical protein